MQIICNKGFDVNSIFKKQFSNFLVSLLFLTFSLNAYSDDLFMPLIDKADRARVEFNELYKYLDAIADYGVEHFGVKLLSREDGDTLVRRAQ